MRTFFGSSSARREPCIGTRVNAAKLRASDARVLEVGSMVSGMLEHLWIKRTLEIGTEEPIILVHFNQSVMLSI